MLACSSRKVLLLDAGRSTGDRRASVVDFSSLDNSAHTGIHDGWTTGLGGTSQLWGGQLWPWEPWEMSLDAAPGLREWPVAYDQIFPYYKRVLDNIGLSAAHQDIHEGRCPAAVSKLPSDDVAMKYSSWMSWGLRNFSTNPSLRLKTSQITVVTGLVVHGINNGAGKCADVVASNAADERVIYRARIVVLAAGTLGNTKVLSGSDVAADLPQLGSGFIDHVSKRVAALSVTDWKKFRAFASHRRYKGVLCSPRIVPTERFARQSGFLPSYAHFEFDLRADSFPRQARDFLRARQGNGKAPQLLSVLSSAARDLPGLVESTCQSLATRQRPILKSSNVYLRVDVQQPTRRDSRLVWQGTGPESNRVGLEWSVGEQENEAANAFGTEVLGVLNEIDVGVKTLEFLPEADFKDIFHMMGGTAMATTPLSGVVDTDLRVFGTDNIYVAGASVFPSGGLANPTFTALALAHRLGLHLESA